jgi:hypothetical protein
MKRFLAIVLSLVALSAFVGADVAEAKRRRLYRVKRRPRLPPPAHRAGLGPSPDWRQVSGSRR